MSEQIYARMLAVQEQVGAIGKNGDNQAQRFKFRSVDDVMNRMHAVLALNHIFCTPKVVSSERNSMTNKNGGNINYSILTIEYTFATDDGSKITCTTVGEGMDSGDKASNKAMAAAYKYAMCQVFCIPFQEEDPDATSYSTIAEKQEAKNDLIAPISELCAHLTERMDAVSKADFAAKHIKPYAGMTNFRNCKSTEALEKLFEHLKSL